MLLIQSLPPKYLWFGIFFMILSFEVEISFILWLNHKILEMGKSLIRYSTWIGRGFFKMLQISLFGVSINVIGQTYVYFLFLSKKKFVSIWERSVISKDWGVSTANLSFRVCLDAE
jgi:hypothetical protein